MIGILSQAQLSRLFRDAPIIFRSIAKKSIPFLLEMSPKSQRVVPCPPIRYENQNSPLLDALTQSLTGLIFAGVQLTQKKGIDTLPGDQL